MKTEPARSANCLYGLKQAPRCWNKRLGVFLQQQGFKTNDADPFVYTRWRNGNKLLLIIYVDDGLLVVIDQQEIHGE